MPRDAQGEVRESEQPHDGIDRNLDPFLSPVHRSLSCTGISFHRLGAQDDPAAHLLELRPVLRPPRPEVPPSGLLLLEVDLNPSVGNGTVIAEHQ